MNSTICALQGKNKEYADKMMQICISVNSVVEQIHAQAEKGTIRNAGFFGLRISALEASLETLEGNVKESERKLESDRDMDTVSVHVSLQYLSALLAEIQNYLSLLASLKLSVRELEKAVKISDSVQVLECRERIIRQMEEYGKR